MIGGFFCVFYLFVRGGSVEIKYNYRKKNIVCGFLKIFFICFKVGVLRIRKEILFYYK